MWIYEKRLEFPVNIKEPNAKMAMFIMSQYGGPDGEMGASMRYLSQRYSMPYKECKAVLTDIGTEELAHLEIVAAIVHQLTRNLTAEQLVEQGFGPYYIDHATGIWPQAAGGIPFNACEFQSKGDVITDLHEDMAAEQKARSTYDNILRVVKDYDVCEPREQAHSLPEMAKVCPLRGTVPEKEQAAQHCGPFPFPYPWQEHGRKRDPGRHSALFLEDGSYLLVL